MKTGELHTFASLFDDAVELVEIPIIQRDYAQGRPEAREVRNNFLDALLQPLNGKEIGETRLNLDFVYGNHPAGSKRFSVLDGQQRLTTLFLLHWYSALRDGEVDDFRQRFTRDGRSRFTYATRASAAEFFDALARETCAVPQPGASLKEVLTDSHWFVLGWQLDPTVQSCLNMLDAIHQAFGGVEGCYARLTREGRISFEFLDLDGFGLSDDLYIKMNARGVPLTSFENFKAWLIGHRSGSAANTDFAHRLDGKWLDVFWRMARTMDDTVDSTRSDRMFMDFFYLMALYETCERDGPRVNAAWLGRLNKRERLSHSDFMEHDSFGEATLVRIAKLLDYLADNPTEADVKACRQALIGNEFMDVARFYSVVCAVCDGSGSATGERRQRWSRVTANLIDNMIIDDTASLALALRGLHGLAHHIGALYETLAGEDLSLVGFTYEQLSEEKRKARLIQQDPAWETLLRQFEDHAYLRGKVGFLLDFSQSGDAHDPTLFLRYSTRTCRLLDDEVRNSPDLSLERALLCCWSWGWDYLPGLSFERQSFCLPHATAFRDRSENWFRVLRQPQFREFLDRLDDSDTLAALERMIATSPCTGWRKHVIADPGMIRYCGQRLIKHYGKVAHLLSKTKGSSRQAEVHSYALYRELRRRLANGTAPAGVNGVEYEDSPEVNPYVYVSFADGRSVSISRRDGPFVCSTVGKPVAVPDGFAELLDAFGPDDPNTAVS